MVTVGQIWTNQAGGGTETGSVTVTAATTGEDLDSEYRVTIGSLSGTVPANGSVTIANVPVGAATVESCTTS